MLVVAQASSGSEAIRLYREHRPDVTLMDLSLPDMTGVEALIAIRKENPAARVVMLTTFEGDVQVRRALEAGAQGYMLKSMPPKELMEVLRRVHSGKRIIPPEIAGQLAEYVGEAPLTAREIEVLRHLAGGNRNRDIAEILCVTEDTVKAHIKHLMEKLGANDRTQAVAIAVRRGFIHL
jgi:DNA-binding NarL/FixJ family response regulator